MTKPYQLFSKLNLNHYAIGHRNLLFDTFRNVLTMYNGRVSTDLHDTARGICKMLVFKTEKEARKWLIPRVTEHIQELRKDLNKDYKKTDIPQQKIDEYIKTYYKIMTLNTLWSENRWQEEYEEGERQRQLYYKEKQGK